MRDVTFAVSEEILHALHATPEELSTKVRLAAAVKLYELGELSSGAAAQLAGVPQPVFLSRLADFDVDTFDIRAAELERDLGSA